nr:15480_t:CDS:10 [Entrophospora candida]
MESFISSPFFNNVIKKFPAISSFPTPFQHLNVNYALPLAFTGFALILTNDNEPSNIIQKHTQFVNIRNKRIRIVHIIHELGAKVPLILFIHGLGGQAAQWEYQIEYFSSTANVLAIDLVGCGKKDYTTESLVEDLIELLRRYPSDNTVLICHSYGCCLGTLLYQRVKQSIKALTLISVKAQTTEKDLERQRRIQSIPDIIFNILRMLDRRGGIHSTSVNRMLSKTANDMIRSKQLLWNKQSKTQVFKCMLKGAKWFTRENIDAIECPLLLISGQADEVTPPSEMALIHEWNNKVGASPQPVIIQESGHVPMLEKPELLNRIINQFLINECRLATLDPAWQIIYETKDENKWSMKNYEKVMRQNDEEHCPTAFIARHPEIGFILDITKDSPPYRTSDFDNSHITYIKFSTASKIPPSRDEVRKFIQIAKEAWNKKPDKQIVVHCHYGFNRTGFMICSYLIEELHLTVADAIKYFEEARKPTGIRHRHFKDELFLRYEPPLRMNPHVQFNNIINHNQHNLNKYIIQHHNLTKDISSNNISAPIIFPSSSNRSSSNSNNNNNGENGSITNSEQLIVQIL